MLKRFWEWTYSYRFEILLVSLVGSFILNMLIPMDIYEGETQSAYLVVLIFAGVNLFSSKKRLGFILVSIVSCLLLFSRGVNIVFTDTGKLTSYIYVLFFLIVGVELFRQMYREKVFNTKIIVATVCGLILIGYLGFLIFTTIEAHHPGSFSGLGEGAARYQDLFYYSYVSMLTIGYGDITPVTWVAKNASILIGLMGNIYSIVIVAIIVSRFTSRK